MHRLNVSLLCLLSLSLAGPALVPSAHAQSDSPGVATYDSYSGGATLGTGTYANVRHMSGNGVGYRGGYSQIGGLVPFWMGDNALIAPDVRLMLGNNSQVGGNVGGLARYYSPGADRIIGAAAYFDMDQSNNNNRYTQGTFGLETLGQYWDLHANGYVVPGTQDNFVGNGIPLCVSGTPFFSGNNVVFQGQRSTTREQAMSGFDIEFGMPVSQATPWLRAYAGTYYYHANQMATPALDKAIPNNVEDKPWGFRTHLDAWIADDLLVGVNLTTDPVWGTNVNAMVDFRFSGFKPTRYFPQWTTKERMLAPWQRNWRIAVEQYGSAGTNDALITAVNPATGKPYFVTFIDNSNMMPGAGTGTFQNPFHSFNHPGGLPQADIIIVERGNSTTVNPVTGLATNPYTGSITLFDNQRLLGQGAITSPLPLAATFGGCNVNGSFVLPTLGPAGGPHPIVQSNTGVPPVTLANNNELAGFTIVNDSGVVIGGDPANINIHDVTIVGSSNPNTPAISITNLTGSNNIIRNVNVLTAGGIGNNSGGGIYLQSGVGGATLTMTNVFMNSKPPYEPAPGGMGTQQPFGIWLNAPAPGAAPNGGGAFNATLTNVHTDGNVLGLKLTETGQNMNVNLINVTASNNTGNGIEVIGSGGSVTLTANTVGSPLLANGNGGNNLSVAMANGGNFTGNFVNAQFNNSTGGSGISLSQGGGTGLLTLSNTQLNGNLIDGLALAASSGGAINVTGSNDQFNSNGRDGLHLVATGNSAITTNFSNSLFNSNGRDGVFYDLAAVSSLMGTFTGDQVNSNKTSAFFGQMNSSTANLAIANTSATNSLANGFVLNAANGSNFTGTLQNDNFSTSGANGMLVSLNGLSTGTFNLTGTAVNGNVQNGVSFSAVNQSMFNMTAVSSTFNNNLANGFIGNLQTGSTGNLATSNGSSISGNTQNGVFVTTAGGSNFLGAFGNTAINGNTNGNGIQLSLAASPASTLALTGTTSLNNNGANGLLVSATSGTIFTPTLSGTSIQGNTLDGVKLSALSGSTIGTAGNAGSFTNVLIRNNGTNGVEELVNGAGSSSNLVFTNAQITNTVGTTPQQVGFLYTASGGGQLTAAFGGGSTLANHNLNALNGLVVGTGGAGSSVANITLDGTNASGSGKSNAVLNAGNGGLQNFTAKNGATLSSSATGSGLVANAAGANTVINVELDTITANSNAGAGFGGSALSGATLNACLDSSSFSNNGLGLGINVSGAGSKAFYGVGTTTAGTGDTVNGNLQQGLLATVANGGELNYRSIGTTYNANGTGATKFDGVDMRVDAAGATNSSIRALFDGGSASNNGRDGFHFGGLSDGASTNKGNLTVSLNNGVAAVGNGRYALNFNANGANTAYLLMDAVTPPVLTGPINLNYAGTTNALASLTGTFHFDGFTGNGLTADFNGATTAVFSLDGKGTSTANNNTLGGINVNMDNVQNSSVLIRGFSNISGNQGGDGIHVSMNNAVTGQGALQLLGVAGGTTMTGNAGKGVNVQLAKVNLLNGFNPALPVITGLTTSSNQGLNACLPLPLTLSSNASVPATGLTIDNFKVAKSVAITGTGGIYVNGTNATVANGGGSISNNTVSNMNGDGIQLSLHNSVLIAPTADAFKLIGNSAVGNTGHGINIDLLRATMNNLNLTGTTTVSANTLDGLHINLDGSSMTRTVDVSPVNINANSNKMNGVFVNAINGSNVFLDVDTLTAIGNTGGAGFTGTALSGSSLNACFGTGSSLSSNSLQGLNITVDGAGSVGNFNVKGATVNSNTQQGLLATVTNHGQLNYRSIGSKYNLNGTGATKFDGVDMRVDATSGAPQSTILALFDSSTGNNNGRDGYHFGGLTDGASTNGAFMTVSLSNGTTLTGNGRYALNYNALGATQANLLMEPSTILVGPTNINVNNVSNQVVLQLIGTSFNNNAGGDGLNLVFDGNVSGIQTAFVSIDGLGTNTIDNNAGNGLSVTMKNLTNGSLLVQNYKSISNNGLDGIFVDMTNVKNGALEIQGQSPAIKTTMAGNKHDAVHVQLTNTSLINNLAAVSPVNGLTLISNQGPPAALNCLPLPTNLPLTNLNVIPSVALKIDSLNVSNSGATGGTGGIIATGTDSTVAANNGFFTNNIVTGSLNGGGIGVTLNNNTVTNQTIDTLVFANNSVTNNQGDGISFNLTNTAAGGILTVKNVNFTNNTVTGNTGRGIVDSLTNNGAANTVVATGSLITGNTVNTNALGGILDSITNNAASTVNANSRHLNNNVVTNNVGDGIVFSLTNGAAGKNVTANSLQFTGNTVTGNTGSGHGIVESITNSAAGVTVSAQAGLITGNTVNSNNGIGILHSINNTAAANAIQAQNTQINNNIVNFNKAGGIRDSINNTVASTTVADFRQINNNSVNQNIGFGIQESIINGAGKATAASSLQISGNTVATNTIGLGILSTLAGGSTFTANNALFTSNTLRNNGTDGLELDWQNVTSNGVNFDGVSSTLHGAGNGMQLGLLNSSLSNVTLSNVTASSNSGGNGILTNLTNSSITGLTATNLKADSNKLNGLSVVAKNVSSLTGATFTTASFQKNGTDGVRLIANDLTASTFGTGAAPIAFNSSTIADNGQTVFGDGVRLRLLGGSSGNLTFIGSKVSNLVGVTQKNGLDFILGSGAGDSGKLTTVFVNSDVSANSIDGIVGKINGTGTAGGSVANVTLSNSRVQNNGAIGADFTINKAGSLGLTIATNSLIDGNQGDGVFVSAIDATAGNDLNGFILNSSLTNNGKSGVGNGMTVNLNNDAKGILTVTNAVIGNTAVGGTQQNGLALNLNQTTVGSATNLVATITTSTLSNNAVSAIAADITGNLTTTTLIPPTIPANVRGAHITLNNVTAANNGGNGMAFLVDGDVVGRGGFLELTALNATIISGSGQNGLFLDASDSKTLASVNLKDSQFKNNGTIVFPGDGFNASLATGATLNVCAETSNGSVTPMAFSGNTGDGFDVLASGVGTRADIDLHEVIAGASAVNGLTGNQLNGVSTQVFDGGVTNLRANTTHFDGNFGAGLKGYVKDAAGFDTIGRFLIIGGTADNNAGDGYSLLAENTTAGPTGVATLTAQFTADDGGTGISAQGNGGFGLSFVASNPPPVAGGIVGNLLMTGGSTLLNNGAGTLNVNMDGADQAIIALSGTFDGSLNGDGIHIALSNITGLALVSLQGPGEVKNNAGDGIDVSLTNVNQGGVFIAGFTDVSNNGFGNNAVTGQDGIKVTMSNVTLGAVKIDSITTSLPANVMNVSNNKGNGVNVTVNNGSLIDNTGFNTVLGTKLVDVIAYTAPEQPCPVPLPNPLLTITPVNVSSALGFSFLPRFAIQNLVLDNNGIATGGNLSGDGIVLTVDDVAGGATTTIVGTPLIQFNTITNTGTGSATGTHDGIVVSVLGSSLITNVDIKNNDVETNKGNGISVIANKAPSLVGLNISSNIVSNNTGTVGSTGNGIRLQLTDAAALATATIDANTVAGNKGDGFQMLNPNTGGTDLTVNFTHNLFDTNGSIVPPSATTTYPAGGMGIDVVLNNVNTTRTTINILSDATGINTVSNSVSYGLFLQATNQALYSLNVTGTGAQNVFNANTDAGIGIVAGSFVNANSSLDPTKFSVGSIVIDNVKVQNTIAGNHPGLPNYPFSGDGIGILAQQYSEIAKFVVGNADPAVRNTLLTLNAGDGLKINAIENSQFRQTLSNGITPVTTLGQATVLLQNIDATFNSRNGVEIIHRDKALLSWDDPAVNAGAALFQLGNPVSWQYITDGGSFVHLNEVIATNNTQNGFNVNTSNAQFPMTRIDIIDTALNGNSQFNGNTLNGMLFDSSADSITIVHAKDTTASNNGNDGILIRVTNAATFGDVVTSTPLGDPTSPNANPSTFNGMTISGNGTNATLGNGIEILSNNQTTDVANITSKAVVAVTMTGTVTHTRNLFDSNAGDGFKLTANRFSTNFVGLNAIDMRDTLFRHLGGDGVHFITNDVSATTLNVTNAIIGYPTASSTQTGLSGNGIHVTTFNGSTMTMLVGDQSIVTPDPTNAPDVSLYGNQGAGILVENTNTSQFFGTVYDTASRFNGNRGYSALLAQNTLAIHQIDSSDFSDNGREGVAMIANAETQSNSIFASYRITDSTLTDPAFALVYDAHHFLNLTPYTIGSLVLTNSIVSSNGNATPYFNSTTNVNGLEIDVSTFAYVSADIRNNTFAGNRLDDVSTASFQASTGSGGSLGGFNANGTINNAGLINTPSSIDNGGGADNLDQIFLEDTAQLDMRFLHNRGDQVSISSGASNNSVYNNANGANVTDASNCKFNNGATSIFQVNGFHYDQVNTVSSTLANTIFTGTNLLPLDGIPTGTVQDNVRFPGPTNPEFGAAAARNLEAGIVNIDQFYFNTHANPSNMINPTAFTQVRVDNITLGQFAVSGSAGNGLVIGYVGGTGQFTLNDTTVAATVGDVFRIHLLDTNTFNQSGVAQNVEQAFINGFTNGITGDNVRIPPGQTGTNPQAGTFYRTNPLSPYFDFPAVAFPPN